MSGNIIKTIIHTISSALEIPAIIILIILILLAVVSLGSLCFEFFAQRIGKKLNAPDIIESLSGKSDSEKLDILEKSNFQTPQKRAFAKLLKSQIPNEERKLLAVQLLTDEEKRLDKAVAITDVIARIGPMFGLMATLIPLGPGLISLGQGDTKGLADSLLYAFDATVAGLVASGVAFIISKIRKTWYAADIETMETVLEEAVL